MWSEMSNPGDYNNVVIMENKTENRIYLTYLNGTGYTFNADDYIRIRSQHRITGKAVGACSSHGHTPKVFALPVEFTNYETQLLLEKGVCTLLKKDSLLKKVDDDCLQEYKNLIEYRKNSQIDILKRNYIEESKKHLNQILMGKRKKLLKSGIKEEDINLSPDNVIKEIEEKYVADNSNILLDIPYEHPFNHEASIYNLPKDDSFKYKVFKDLWEKGKYVTSGEIFGGDFIAYPGDPMAYHASHIVIVLNSPIIPPLDIIAKVRLAVNVNKICVFAYPGINNHVVYQTVKWHKVDGQEK